MSDAFKYQIELMSGYADSNKLAHDKNDTLINAGHAITMTGTTTGPYTTYFYSNGESVTIITPSSLSWVPIPPVVY